MMAKTLCERPARPTRVAILLAKRLLRLRLASMTAGSFRRIPAATRSRRTITRKSQIQDICLEGICDARDPSLHLPSDKPRPSPLPRQSFDQSWERWKAREAEEKALAEMDKTQLEMEQQRLFGGDVDDDVSLCESMLQVVMHLFGGLDYADP